MRRPAPHLSHRLILESPIRAADGAGGFSTAWTQLGALYAHIAADRPVLLDGPGAAEARVGLRITLRGAPPGAPSRPVPGQRLRQGDRAWAIESVRDHGPAGKFLLVLAREEAAS